MPSFNLAAARDWMLRLYDQSFGLFRAAPYAKPDCNTFWLYNDNHLVFSTLKYYCAVNPNFRSARIVVLDGQTMSYHRNPNMTETIEQRGNMVVMNEYTPQTGAPIPVGQYSDIDFYDAINQFNSGNKTGAVTAFQLAEKTFWDGVGFKDKSWSGIISFSRTVFTCLLRRLLVQRHSTLLNVRRG
jgi:hypothetical protein